MSATRGARARVREALTAEILDAAREELSAVGPAALSLRSVARRLEMVPSALYRYFPSRDHILTALIVEAYHAVGATASGADEACLDAGGGPMQRWMAVCRGVRGWAHAHPQRWALIYGSPVPGYAAPQDTVEAALVITRVVTGIIPAEPVHPAGALPPSDHLEAAIDPLRQELLPGRSAGAAVAGLMAWTALIGTVSLELFGHYKGGTADFDAVFDYAMQVAGRVAGLAGPA